MDQRFSLLFSAAVLTLPAVATVDFRALAPTVASRPSFHRTKKAKADANGPRELAQQGGALDANEKCLTDTALKGRDYVKEQSPSSTMTLTD
jgi:electron transfer flavoprotein alpha/beta subunit